MMAALVVHHPEEMNHGRIIRIVLEQGVVDPCGVGLAAGLLKLVSPQRRELSVRQEGSFSRGGWRLVG
jgi:hypothetical protein